MIENGKLKTKVLNILAPFAQGALRDLIKGNDSLEGAKASLNHAAKSVSFWIKTIRKGSFKVGHLKEEYYDFLKELKEPEYTTKITGGGTYLCWKSGEEIKEIVQYADVNATERALIASGEYIIKSRHYGMNVEASEKLPE